MANPFFKHSYPLASKTLCSSDFLLHLWLLLLHCFFFGSPSFMLSVPQGSVVGSPDYLLRQSQTYHSLNTIYLKGASVLGLSFNNYLKYLLACFRGTSPSSTPNWTHRIPVQDSDVGRSWTHLFPWNTESIPIYETIFPGKKENLKTSQITPSHCANERETTWKWIGKAETQSPHKAYS